MSFLNTLLLFITIITTHSVFAQVNNFSNDNKNDPKQIIMLNCNSANKNFDGIGVVNGGGATSVLLKDYPEPQRSQILDLLYKPKFGASVSTLLVEIPGDGNSTQGSMPSHMHDRNELNYFRGYTWWILKEAKKRNPKLSLDATAWSAPGWIGNGNFWSQDAADYYIMWLKGLRGVYNLELDAIGCRNEKGFNYNFAKILRASLTSNGFQNVKVHAFDHWTKDKLSFIPDLETDTGLRKAIDIISAHVFYEGGPATPQAQKIAEKLGKPIWNTEDHVYKKGFDCLISIVECFNRNYIQSGVTKVVNWYDIGGVYPIEPYSEDPAAVIAQSPWSGHYEIRDALWGYAHYGQFTELNWKYLNSGCLNLAGGGSVVSLKSPSNDYSIIIETKGAKKSQKIEFIIDKKLSAKKLCLWVSDQDNSFVRKEDIIPIDGVFQLALAPNTVYSLSTTSGQHKGGFKKIPKKINFPFPYYETFEQYHSPKEWGHLPQYTADIIDAFELTNRPDGSGMCIRQVIKRATNSWAPDWRPYTILGDANWSNYEISADVYLNDDDVAGVMGRINHVGTGYGIIPKGYYFELAANGRCRLVVSKGKKDKKQLMGDGEQQALIKKQNDNDQGGEHVLGEALLPEINHRMWYNLKLCFNQNVITAFIDGKKVLEAKDSSYTSGMAGLIAGGGALPSTPFYDNILVNKLGGNLPKASTIKKNHKPLYHN